MAVTSIFCGRTSFRKISTHLNNIKGALDRTEQTISITTVSTTASISKLITDQLRTVLVAVDILAIQSFRPVLTKAMTKRASSRM